MIAKIGSEMDPTRSRMAAFAQTPKGRELQASIGVQASPAPLARGGLRPNDPREAEMRRLALKAGVGAGMYPNSPNGQCDTTINDAAFQDILLSLAQSGGSMATPAGFTAEQWIAIQALIRAGEYCPKPNRTGWQCSAMSFFSAALAANATVTITRTSTRAFCMEALLGGVNAGDVSTIQLTSLLVDGTEYVNDGPLFMKYYTSEAACCLCVSVIPVIPPNTPIAMTFLNGGNAPQNVEVEAEGRVLLCGGQ